MTAALAIAGFLGAICTALAAWWLDGRRRELIVRACHELRGPITAARLAIELGDRHGELSADRLRAVELELDRAALALEDLGGASMPGSGSRVSKRIPRGARRGATTPSGGRVLEVVRAEEVLVQSVEASRALAAARGVQLRLASCTSASVRGDRLRLAQATDNLITNAIEHGGGVVEVRARADAGYVRLEVTDGGTGLPAPVVRLVRRARRGRGQRGRGLAIASAIAHEHGGRVRAAPSERGARLVLELPACSPAAGPSLAGRPD